MSSDSSSSKKHRKPLHKKERRQVKAFKQAFADFYAIDPSDNALPIPAGSDIAFPRLGPSSKSGIKAVTNTSFNLTDIATYSVNFEVPIVGNAQLVVTLNGAELPYTVVGKVAPGSQIVGTFLIKTNIKNSILTIRNPQVDLTPIIVEPSSGGTLPSSSHLVIIKLI